MALGNMRELGVHLISGGLRPASRKVQQVGRRARRRAAELERAAGGADQVASKSSPIAKV